MSYILLNYNFSLLWIEINIFTTEVNGFDGHFVELIVQLSGSYLFLQLCMHFVFWKCLDLCYVICNFHFKVLFVIHAHNLCRYLLLG